MGRHSLQSNFFFMSRSFASYRIESASYGIESVESGRGMDGFIAQYDQPVSIASLAKLDPAVLVEAISSLSNSVAHLLDSNAQIIAFTTEEEGEMDEASKREFEVSVTENRKTMYALELSLCH